MGIRMKAISEINVGDRIDLESDIFADPEHDHAEYEFEWAVVDEIERETENCICLYFTNGSACGFPLDHKVKVESTNRRKAMNFNYYVWITVDGKTRQAAGFTEERDANEYRDRLRAAHPNAHIEIDRPHDKR